MQYFFFVWLFPWLTTLAVGLVCGLVLMPKEVLLKIKKSSFEEIFKDIRPAVIILFFHGPLSLFYLAVGLLSILGTKHSFGRKFIALAIGVAGLIYSYSEIQEHRKPRVRIGCICEDGWRSSATGSGACSHHGGVDYWLYAGDN